MDDIDDPVELERWAYKLTDRLGREGVIDATERRQLLAHLDDAFGEAE
ncbi:MAG: hypothetical protein ABEJ74_04140 [Haloferacaceae archaeon]